MIVEDPDVERSVISLPDFVGTAGFPTMQQIETLGVGLRAFVGKRDRRRVQVADQAVDLAVGRLWPAMLPSDRSNLALNGRERAPRSLECEALDRLTQS